MNPAAPDFDRNVYCVLGLPFDALDMEGAVARVREAVRVRTPCFFSTPNLSFVTAAQANPGLRDSVLRSDLSIADGMPLLWAARLMGVPLPERVAGSSLFTRLWQGAWPEPIKVFFFGGDTGVAAAAAERLNSAGTGLRCVGHESPGFGSVQQMSGDDCIARVNTSGAEFIVVSIGVAKGQAWIEHNRARLHAPVIAYLGAVVNFVAEKVARAPRWMQHAGLEWLWRIKEEPALWRRYARDGATFARLLATRVLPYAWQVRRHAPGAATLAEAAIDVVHAEATTEVRLRGAWVADNLAPLRRALSAAWREDKALRLDLSGVSHLDSAAVALLCTLWAHCAQQARALTIHGVSPAVQRVIRSCCAEYVLQPQPASEPIAL
ncbi:MAG TPA: WecB/TagA/CpsF family glycosyltransferase [Burkholderiaceae bacterium]|nr:WecB/TagA/CpsF family glycosyltransferase [Burkholderiaceae bacterium]